MEKLWTGRTSGENAALADAFNRSIAVDGRMFKEDIAGSMAHAAMLGARGILPQASVDHILNGLQTILDDLTSGALAIDPNAEDIHSFIELELTRRIGDEGKMLHTARSRNDQVALDLRMYLRAEAKETQALIAALQSAILGQAEKNADAVMPGYTHLQRAQPITFGQWLLAYACMLQRDYARLTNAQALANESPLGAAALAGTSYPIDRASTASALGFSAPAQNSLDAVSDRDFCVEYASARSILMMHLSRLCEELVLFTSWEFKFIELSDAFSTGSSIMPQKKNSDMAELVRGKTGRVYGDLVALLTLLKGLPLAYNKDLQEDKEAVFDAFDTAKACLAVLAPMLGEMRVNTQNMRRAAAEGFLNATDCADYLVKKGLPFRAAYKITGQIVAKCIAEHATLETLPLSAYQSFSELFGQDVYAAVDLDACVQARTSLGGTAPAEVLKQITALRGQLAKQA